MYDMYYFLFIFLIIALLFCTVFHFKKKKIIKKIKCMDRCEKCILLDELVKPLGSAWYIPSIKADSISILGKVMLFSIQRSEGLEKRPVKNAVSHQCVHLAPRFQMVTQFEPIYFDYDGKTWLIEFWKGQYGINTGAEIGIYHTDTEGKTKPKTVNLKIFWGIACMVHTFNKSRQHFHIGKSNAVVPH